MLLILLTIVHVLVCFFLVIVVLLQSGKAADLAGAFGGVLGALVQTIIGDTIPYARRARASGTVSAAFSFSTVVGVPLSLWLANHFQWRAPFIFIVALVAVFMVIPMYHEKAELSIAEKKRADETRPFKRHRGFLPWRCGRPKRGFLRRMWRVFRYVLPPMPADRDR